MKALPLNLGYDPECRSCNHGIRSWRDGQDEDGMGGIELRVFCVCVEPMPVASDICVECPHNREEHTWNGRCAECMCCMCKSFVPVML